jgi:hypothetical protein
MLSGSQLGEMSGSAVVPIKNVGTWTFPGDPVAMV